MFFVLKMVIRFMGLGVGGRVVRLVSGGRVVGWWRWVVGW